jgi:hypothetical protein
LGSRTWRALLGWAQDGAPDLEQSESPERQEMNGWARFGWTVALILSAAFRVICALHFRIDSDEPQHLHVVWGWANGLLPYRDIFDNHAPVFQALCAPLFHLLGVRADIVLPMRLAMLPLFAMTLYCVYRIVATFSTPQTAAWSTALLALCPPFFFSSLEFRPDQLWMAIWLAALATLICGRATSQRALMAGLLLGLAFAVSMKTVVMLVVLVSAVAVTLLLFQTPVSGNLTRWRNWSIAGGFGLIIIPAVVMGLFVALGVGRDMYYCVIQHNVNPGPTDFFAPSKIAFRIVAWLLIPVAGVWVIKHLALPKPIKMRVCVAFLVAAFYQIFLVGFWPVLTAETYLPLFPTAALTAGPLLVHLSRVAFRSVGWRGAPSALPWILAELAWMGLAHHPFTNHTRHKIGIVADTLRLTTASDYVMDSKGETIYRKRPFRFVLERMTLGRMGNGQIDNDIIQRLIETRTPLVTTRRMPRPVLDFMTANYVPIALRLMVLGQKLSEPKSRVPTPVPFVVTIPARYTFVTPKGIAEGQVDGVLVAGPCELTAGSHEFLPTKVTYEPTLLVWSAALERGYSPFREIPRDKITPED